VSVSGLPNGASAQVLVTGPASFSRVVTGTQTLTNLNPGTSEISSSPVTNNGVTYSGTTSDREVVVTASLIAAPVAVHYAGATGELAVEVQGLPATVGALVRLTRPGGQVQQISQSQVLEGLPPGQYLLEASSVAGTSDTWDPDITSRQVQVRANERTSAGITFTPRTGTLTVSVVGLSPGVAANVRVTGPNGTNRLLSASGSVSDLMPGTYTITAQSVTSGSTQYVPTPATSTVSITRGSTSTRTISYGGQSTALTVDFSGLPADLSPSAQVTGPGSFSRSVTGPTVLEELAAGTYRVAATRVNSSTASWDPAPSTRDVPLTIGERRIETVSYTLATGSLAISVGGLPRGSTANLTVTGPAGFSQHVLSTQTLTHLTPGTYTVTAGTVTINGTTFAPTPVTRTVTVSASLVAAAAPVSYANAVGALRVTLSGLPAATTNAATVSGPGGASFSLAQTTLLSGLATGPWQVTGNPVIINEDRYTATPASANTSVLANDTANVPLGFSRQTAHLSVAVTGLPAGTASAITVTGPAGYSRTVTETTTLRGLEAGTYTISAQSVTVGSTVYTPSTGSVTLTATAGASLSRTVSYAGQTTGLALSVGGLPNGTPAAITITGPAGFSQTATGSTTLTGLAAGTYTIAATRVVAGLYGFTAAPASQSASVAAGSTASASVAYAVSTGALTISVSGLPNGTNAPITVTGPGSFSRTVTATATLADLAPGTYTVAAAALSVGPTQYTPSAATQTVSVTAGATASRSVAYTGSGTSLAITVNGVPGGATGAVQVSGPNGYTQAVTATTTLANLAAGTYTVAASNIAHGGFTYGATPASQAVSLATGENKGATVTYAATTGRLTVSVSGLPAGTSAAITVTGPGNYSQAVTQGTTLQGLVPGTYTVAAANVTSGTTLFTPSAATQTVSVTAGATASRSVAYTGSGTSLAITVNGVPGGATGAVQVSGPNGYTQAVTATTTLANLAAGTYTVAASNIAHGGYTYGATPASQAVSLATGENKSATVTYAATTGRLTVSVSGLPAGTSAAVTVTGPGGFSQGVTGTATLNQLTPGTYTVAAASVTVGSTTYAPSSASQTAGVSAGATASSSVTYTVTGGGAGPNLVLEGAHVTQAIQNFAGTVPLVAGREALLRVFVTASATNSLTPTVRVRLYEGSTIFRTFTINASGASVPQSVDESTLGNSWNATLTASDMRANLRIQVDVDPANAVAEPDETDNIWPRTGTQALDVRTVAPFNVVFVPVHQTATGLTGNINASNLESTFLSMTRRIFPLAQIGASIRATYTTNTQALQSNDGNSAWLSLLSELNMLRMTEGGSSNYYGVVGTTYGSGIAGYGYVPGRTAVGWDKSGSANRVTAHELGHNFNRRHVAACGSGNTDQNYPYAGGVIGNTGWNSGTGQLVASSTTDIMGYCSNQWISDYTWTGVMNYRGAGGAVAFGSATQTALVVWGRVHRGVVTLEPALRVITRPSLPERGGRYAVELRDKTGRAMQRITFEPEAVDHDDEAYAFSFAIPLDAFTEARLTAVAVTGGGNGTVEQVASPAMVAAMNAGTDPTPLRTADGGAAQVTDPRAGLSATGTTRRVTWDDAAWPLAIVREASTGRVIATLRRSGDGFVPAGGDVSITFSNGVQSLTQAFGAP
jgi:hypothetical protein